MIIEAQFTYTFKERIRLIKDYLKLGYKVEVLDNENGGQIIYATLYENRNTSQSCYEEEQSTNSIQ